MEDEELNKAERLANDVIRAVQAILAAHRRGELDEGEAHRMLARNVVVVVLDDALDTMCGEIGSGK